MRADLAAKLDALRKEIIGEELGNKVKCKIPLSKLENKKFNWRIFSKIMIPGYGDKLIIESFNLLNEIYPERRTPPDTFLFAKYTALAILSGLAGLTYYFFNN